MPPCFLISAGESSGDRYAAHLAESLRAHFPGAEFFGCAGERMKEAGVRPVVDMASLAVVGLVEVLHHLPRIYGDYRRLLAEARRVRPEAAILTDSPDFHLRLAPRLRALGIPVYYLVAPQAWAWRERRVAALRRNVRELYCIFPFEEEFFRQRGVEAAYIGHPLTRMVRPSLERRAFFAKYGIPEGRPLITICPGSRRGEVSRHLPPLARAVGRIVAETGATALLAAPKGAEKLLGSVFLTRFCVQNGVKLAIGETWDAMAHADLTLAASGTVTVEAALLGAPMVTFYRVTAATWMLGRSFVRVPFFSMPNLIAGRRVVPELIQGEMTGKRIAAEALELLKDGEARERMKDGLAEVRAKLATSEDPMECAAARIAASLKRGIV